MINYVAIFALVLLVVGLSMPTIIHLSALLKNDRSQTPASPAIANYGD